MIKIEIKNVSKIFGTKPRKVLKMLQQGATKTEILEETNHTVGLDNVSINIEAGKTSVIMGLSGSGKSTLIRHINRLIDPTAGSILIDGEDVLSLNKKELIEFRRKKMSMVFQKFGLFPHRNVIDNVGYGLEVQGIEENLRKEKAKEQIHLVGLEGFENQFPNQLSGGMQQRVGLARALATNSEILLMDEAFSALDPLIRNDMQKQLIELQRQINKTIVFITHDLDEALRLGDQITILNDGQVIQIGTSEEIILRPADEYVKSFVKDVNRGKVLTAKTLMIPLEEVNTDQIQIDTLETVDAMQTADTFIPKIIKENKPIAVKSKQDKIIGIVTAQDLLRLFETE